MFLPGFQTRVRRTSGMTKQTLAAAAFALACVSAHAQESGPAAAPACLAPATWYSLSGPKPRAVPEAEIVAQAARRDVVLLGEHHDDPDHHQWQLQALAAMHLQRPSMVIGFEAFPRRVQPVLDRWIAGELTAREFLERVEWQKIWNLPSELYLPLFNFARLNRIPIFALNVDRTLTEEIRRKGWDAVPADQKEGLTRPAAAARAYEDYLFEVFRQHPADEKDKRTPARGDPAFRRFVESQTTWDRAMAEALASRARTNEPRPLVVGIMGSGHVRERHGVPHQLRDLGVTKVATLLPLAADTPCSEIKSALADAVFALPARMQDKPPPPRLGVRLEMRDKAVAVSEVTAGSLADHSGIKAGDVVTSVAGAPAATIARVIGAIREQPPGTWLPMQIRRGESTLDLVIKFPPKI